MLQCGRKRSWHCNCDVHDRPVGGCFSSRSPPSSTRARGIRASISSLIPHPLSLSSPAVKQYLSGSMESMKNAQPWACAARRFAEFLCGPSRFCLQFRLQVITLAEALERDRLAGWGFFLHWNLLSRTQHTAAETIRRSFGHEPQAGADQRLNGSGLLL